MSRTVRTTIVSPEQAATPSWRARVRAALGSIDRSDVLVLIGLMLVGAGAWQYSPAAAAVAVGAIVLWYGMPTRPPFVGGSN